MALDLENLDKMTVTDEDGKELLLEVLFSYEDEETGRTYFAFTEVEEPEGEEYSIYAFYYDKAQNEDKLLPLESDEEWEIFNQILQGVMEDDFDDDVLDGSDEE